MAWTESRLLGTATGFEIVMEREGREVGLLVVELLVVERYGLATTNFDSLAPSRTRVRIPPHFLVLP